MKILITGVAGFIGHALAWQLAKKEGCHIIGIDNLNDYYDVALKQARLANLQALENVEFLKADISDTDLVNDIFEKYAFDYVVHLAAQAGVRYSLENPMLYAKTNMVGQLNILEACRHFGIKHLVYASSSSVYGMNKKMPFSTDDTVDHPVSLYAATKKSGELMAHTYAHLYGLPSTGLRFFTVYGPWGRPDMAIFKFTQRIINNEPIDVYNHGDMSRDFTYIDDIVEGIVRVMDHPPAFDASWDSLHQLASKSSAPYRLYNIGHGSPVALMDFVRAIEQETGVTARINFLPMQPGDVKQTWADTSHLAEATGYRARVGVTEGVRAFVKWYRDYHDC